MKSHVAGRFASGLVLATVAMSPCRAAPIKVEIVNDSHVLPESVYLLVTGDPKKPLELGGIKANVSTTLKALTGGEFTVGAISTNYEVNLSPPLAGKIIDAGTATSYTVPGPSAGTPYTVSVTATNATATSEAIPLIVPTLGVAGTVGWHFIAFFTGAFPGDKVTFNGVAQTVPSSPNPSLPWDSPTIPALPPMGQPGSSNAYVFDWKDGHGSPVYASILYVDLASSPVSGLGDINRSASATFMANNLNLPTYDSTRFNLHLSIAPTIRRTLCAAGGR